MSPRPKSHSPLALAGTATVAAAQGVPRRTRRPVRTCAAAERTSDLAEYQPGRQRETTGTRPTLAIARLHRFAGGGAPRGR